MNLNHPLFKIFEDVPGLVRFAFHLNDQDRTNDKTRYLPASKLFDAPNFERTDRHILFSPVTRKVRSATKKESMATRVLWLDIDTPDLPDFPSTFIPSYIIKSGHGHHCYWLLDRVLNVEFGSKLAHNFETALKIIAKRFGGDISPTHTAANMRVPGSFNIKKGAAIPVTWSGDGRVYSAGLINVIAKKHKRERVVSVTGNRHESADAETMLQGCAFMRYARDYANDLDEPLWFDVLRTCVSLPGGQGLAHRLSEGHREYSDRSCSVKINNALNYKPATCDKFASEGACGDCPWRGVVKSPAGIPYKIIAQRAEESRVRRHEPRR